MTKLKAPLLGIKAYGTLANSVTFQRRDRGTFARRKPVPTDPQTDKQLWHRHLYLVLCQYWNGLSAAQKATWESDARRKHITGFNYFLRTELNKLGDIALYLPLNKGSGSAAIDFSGKQNHGTIYGASWVDGKFGKCLSFDAIDDWALIPSAPELAPAILSIEFWIYPKAPLATKYVVCKTLTTGHARDYTITLSPTGEMSFWFGEDAANYVNLISSALVADTWTHVIALRNGTRAIFYLDGVEDTSTSYTHTPVDKSHPLKIANLDNYAPRYFYGLIDEVFILNRALTDAEALLHFNRKESP